MHQLVSVAACTAAAVLIERVRQQSREAHARKAVIHAVQRAVPSDNRRLLIAAHAHPRHDIVLKGALQTVERAELEDLAVLFHKGDLVLDLGDLLCTELS